MCGEGVSYGCQFHLGKGDGCGCCLRLSYKEWGDSEKPFTDAGMCRRVAYYGGHSGGESPHASTYKGVWEMNPLINDNRK